VCEGQEIFCYHAARLRKRGSRTMTNPSIKDKRADYQFGVEVRQLLELVIGSLYSNKEVPLRELISNASDALEKLRFEALQDDSLYEKDADPKIRVEYDKKNRTVAVIDNGIGMSREELRSNLGTIASSGTRKFLKALQGKDATPDSLIGCFGVGFYSAFVIADKVEVSTRKAGAARTAGARWTSRGKGRYSIQREDRPARGTRVTLHLKKDEGEFLDGYRLREITRKYCDHIGFPIVMAQEGEGAGKEETVNKATALWKRSGKEIADQEYREFYKHIAHDFEDPLCYVHKNVEGKTEYTFLLYIPAAVPAGFWERRQLRGVKLYSHRVFIMEAVEQFLPPWLRFVRGVIDSDDLPLNISREILQTNQAVDSIRRGCTRRVLDQLKTMAEREPEKYRQFWRAFGAILKEGVVEAGTFRDDVTELLRFASTREARDEEAQVSFHDYRERMKEGQKEIYFLATENPATARSSPHLELAREHGLEVLLGDPVDEWVLTHLGEYRGLRIKWVNKGDLDLPDAGDEEPEGKETGERLASRIADCLKGKVQEVRPSRRLRESACCLAYGDQEMSAGLQRALKAAGHQPPDRLPILEINPGHVLVRHIGASEGEERLRDWSLLLLEQAMLNEGAPLRDPADFVRRLNRLLGELVTPQ